MVGSGSSACRLCHGLLKEVGRTLGCLSAPERRRQPSAGRKHHFLRIVSLHVCEPHLGSHSYFLDRQPKASFISVVQPIRQKVPFTCERSISKTFPNRSENHQRDDSDGCRRIFPLRSGESRSRWICRSGIPLISRWCAYPKANRCVPIMRMRRNRSFILSFPGVAMYATRTE